MIEPVFTFIKPLSAEESFFLYQRENVGMAEEKFGVKINQQASNKNCDENWKKIASAASDKLVKELDEKKVIYDEMNDKKRTVEKLMGVKGNEVKEKRKRLDQYSSEIAEKSSLIFAKEMAVKMIKGQIKKEMEARQCLQVKKQKEERALNGLSIELKILEKDLEKLKSEISDVSAIDDIVGKNSELKTTIEDIQVDMDKFKKTAEDYEDFLEKSIAAKVASLECPVCLTTAEPPIFSCHKMHHICEKCFDKLDDEAGGYNSGQCPVCRLKYYRYKNETRHRPAEATWEEVQALQEKLKILKQNKSFKKELEEREKKSPVQ